MKNIFIISSLFIGMLYACTNDLDYIESPELTFRALVDENYGTRPNQVHTPPYSVIVNYNQPYLN